MYRIEALDDIPMSAWFGEYLQPQSVSGENSIEDKLRNIIKQATQKCLKNFSDRTFEWPVQTRFPWGA